MPMVAKPTMLNKNAAPTAKQAQVTIFVTSPFWKSSARMPPTSGSKKAIKAIKLKFKMVVDTSSAPSPIDSVYPNASCAPVYE